MVDNSEKFLLYLFDHIGKLLREKVGNRLSAHNLHFGQARVLLALKKHDSLTQKAIGYGLDIKPATVTNFVKRMELSGLIERSHDARDDRIMNVSLTVKGKKAAKLAHKIFFETEEQLRAEFSMDEVADIERMLLLVRDTCGGAEPSL